MVKQNETEIKFDKRNYRIHDDRNKDLIKKSLDEYGAGRSILIDAEGEIIAGNGVYEQAKELGMPVKVIETDGKELIALQRTDLKTEDDVRKGLAIMDNSTSDASKFDTELLKVDFDVPTLQEMGVPVIEPIEIDWERHNEITEEDYKEPEEKTLECPVCHHKDMASRFRNVK